MTRIIFSNLEFGTSAGPAEVGYVYSEFKKGISRHLEWCVLVQKEEFGPGDDFSFISVFWIITEMFRMSSDATFDCSDISAVSEKNL